MTRAGNTPALEPALAVLRSEHEHHTRAKVHQIAREHGLSPDDLYNALSLEVARRFLDGSMTFGTADGIANTIQAIMVEDAVAHGDGFEFVEPAYAVYLAFDAGEWDRGDGYDPVKRYTTPVLLEILSRHPGTP